MGTNLWRQLGAQCGSLRIFQYVPDFSRQKWVDCVQPVIQIFLIHSLDQKDILFGGDAKGVLDNLLLFS